MVPWIAALCATFSIGAYFKLSRRLFSGGFPGAFGAISSVLAIVLGAAVVPAPWNALVCVLAIALFVGQWAEASSAARKRSEGEGNIGDLRAMSERILAHLTPNDAESKAVVDVLLNALVVSHWLWMFTSEQTARQYQLTTKRYRRIDGRVIAGAREDVERAYNKLLKESRKQFDNRYRSEVDDVIARIKALGIDTSRAEETLADANPHLYAEDEAYMVDDLIGVLLSKYISVKPFNITE